MGREKQMIHDLTQSKLRIVPCVRHVDRFMLAANGGPMALPPSHLKAAV